MLFLLSPAKSLDYETPVAKEIGHTQPLFVQQSEILIDVLRRKSPQDIASLMSVSDALATLNVARYAAWSSQFTKKNSKQAILAFNGDVYEGLDAKSLPVDDLNWAQSHVIILSGLYGVLRPLDWMQPYRLEMGTALENPSGKNLYQFWGTRIAKYLNEQQVNEAQPVVVNLASQEYFKSVDRKALQAKIVECVFEEYKSGQYKVVSFFAKRARGLMVRYAIEHRCTEVENLKNFQSDGYAFDAAVSESDRFVFRRKQ